MTWGEGLKKLFGKGKRSSKPDSTSSKTELSKKSELENLVGKRAKGYSPEGIIDRFNTIANHYKTKRVEAKATQIKQHKKTRRTYNITFDISGILECETKYRLEINRNYDEQLSYESPTFNMRVVLRTNSDAVIEFLLIKNKPNDYVNVDEVQFDLRHRDAEAKKLKKYVHEKYKKILTTIKTTAPDLFETATAPFIGYRPQNLDKKLAAIEKLDLKNVV
ncbi:hypothetical protein HOK51_09335 [Candidatus Woesearchaeota archaeon]|jgi:hypothetical protein|nr:hypothetical protein [Candidatus Woesearchaeota archaeon]MBT6520031.1 hypothetical protein [Candidatus Woesearchaeota archaeon]MBT7368614.1 hypothetical protein [Candidatus Woesearchaeota archaeon]